MPYNNDINISWFIEVVNNIKCDTQLIHNAMVCLIINKITFLHTFENIQLYIICINYYSYIFITLTMVIAKAGY